jgi:hypothetical protein
MFLIRWIRELVALPFGLLGRLCMMLGSPWSADLIKLNWRITGDADSAFAALLQVQKHRGTEASAREARQWMESSPHPVAAAWLGMLAVGQGERDEALDWLNLCATLEGDSAGLVEMLEYFLAAGDPDAATTEAVVRRLEQRRDLPVGLSKMIHTEMLWMAVTQGRLDEARRRAEHMLEIDDDPGANIVMWTLARRDGEGARTARFRQRAQRGGGLADDQRLYFLASACEAVGFRDEALQILPQLREHNADLAGMVQQRLDQERDAT